MILLLGVVLCVGTLSAQPPRNFLERAFSPSDQPLLSALAPGFSLTVASREFDVERTDNPKLARLTVAGIPLRFELRYELKRASISTASARRRTPSFVESKSASTGGFRKLTTSR